VVGEGVYPGGGVVQLVDGHLQVECRDLESHRVVVIEIVPSDDLPLVPNTMWPP
jgi:hypothetical protein